MCQKWGCHHENQQEILQEDLELHRKWMCFIANTGIPTVPSGNPTWPAGKAMIHGGL